MNKKGFTLIELIAVIALVGIMAVLILPQVGNNIEDRKESQYENVLKVIESSAKLYYAENTSTTKVLISDLVSGDYLSSGITDPRTGSVITGCVYIYLDSEGYNKFTYMDSMDNCSGSQFYYSLVVKPMDGLYNGSTDNVSYKLMKNATQSVTNPTRDGYNFSGWGYSCDGCSISSEVFTMGESNVVLQATWTPKIYTLTTDLDGGTIGSAPPASASYKSLTTLSNPTKTGYTFIHWEVVSGNESSITNNVLTMGKENTVIKAIFEKNAYTKTNHTCNRTIATYTKVTRSCNRGPYTYNETRKTCYISGVNPYWGTSTSTKYSCYTNPSFTCGVGTVGNSYVSGCSIASYVYSFGDSSASVSSCSTTTAFSCDYSTYGSSYVASCGIESYNYYFDTASTTINQCTETASFTCNSGTYQGTYTTCAYTG